MIYQTSDITHSVPGRLLWRALKPGVCRPCDETKLTATEKSATDGN